MNQGPRHATSAIFFGSSNKEPDVLAVLEHQYDVQNVKVEIEKVILPN